MNVLVTGGGGFLGAAIVRRLVLRGDHVRSLARHRYPDLDKLGVEQIQGDISERSAVLQAAANCDAIVHVAAKAGIWGRAQDYQRTNVDGTAHVILACRQLGIGKLVYTSSPSVVFDGKDMAGVNESVPYPAHHEAHYPRTKAVAEQLVLQANGPQLATMALRPHLIWGPADNHLVPRLLARAKAGRLRRIGTASPLIDSIYIDNAADAHVLALDRLGINSAVAGKAYFLSQGEPLPLWDLVNRILATANLPPVTRSVSKGMALTAGWVLEGVHGLLGWQSEPLMTRFLARELSTAHWFDISAARRDLGYVPQVSTDEGLQRLKQWLGNGEKRKSADG
jgi:nucleoside-diphosphate-sugar epimerase